MTTANPLPALTGTPAGFTEALEALDRLIDVLRARRTAIVGVLRGGEFSDIDQLDIDCTYLAALGEFPPPITIRVSDEATVAACAAAIRAAILPVGAVGAVGRTPVLVWCVTAPAPGVVSTNAAPTTPVALRVVPAESDRGPARSATSPDGDAR